MPILSSRPSSLATLIGLPPKIIPAISIISFLAMGITLYYLFFEFRFTYNYEGFFAVSNANHQEVVVTIPTGQNLSKERTNKWLVTITPLHQSFTGAFQHQLDLQQGKMKNNSFVTILPKGFSSTLQRKGKVPCTVQLTSTSLMEKVW